MDLGAPNWVLAWIIGTGSTQSSTYDLPNEELIYHPPGIRPRCVRTTPQAVLDSVIKRAAAATRSFEDGSRCL